MKGPKALLLLLFVISTCAQVCLSPGTVCRRRDVCCSGLPCSRGPTSICPAPTLTPTPTPTSSSPSPSPTPISTTTSLVGSTTTTTTTIPSSSSLLSTSVLSSSSPSSSSPTSSVLASPPGPLTTSSSTTSNAPTISASITASSLSQSILAPISTPTPTSTPTSTSVSSSSGEFSEVQDEHDNQRVVVAIVITVLVALVLVVIIFAVFKWRKRRSLDAMTAEFSFDESVAVSETPTVSWLTSTEEELLTPVTPAPAPSTPGTLRDSQPDYSETFDQLPAKVQKMVLDAGISAVQANAQFPVLLHLLHARTDINFVHAVAKPEGSIRDARKAAGLRTKLVEPVGLLHVSPWQRYQRKEQIGRGSYGVVHRALAGKTPVAIKSMPHKTNHQKEKNYNEFSVLQQLQHPNSVTFHNGYVYEGEFYLVTELLELGSLSEVLRGGARFTHEETAFYIHGIVSGLLALHRLNYIYRDLKGSNLMFGHDGQLKLIDMGLCYNLELGQTTHFAGSPHWIAPEIIQRRLYGVEVDIWSAGIVIFELLTGHPPLYQYSPLAAMLLVAGGHFKPMAHLPANSPSSLVELVNVMLQREPSRRPTASQVLGQAYLQLKASPQRMQQRLVHQHRLSSLSHALPFDFAA